MPITNSRNKIKTIFLLLLLAPIASQAVIEYDQDVTPDIIFGSGNSNGAFTTDRNNGLEVGLRAKIPFVGTTNSNGDSTYSFTLLETDHDNNVATPNRWNFEFTVNTDFDDSTSINLDQYTYELGMDSDPSLGVNYLVFDPITPNVAPLFAPFFDHSIGDNSTANGAGTEAGDGPTYTTLLAGNNVLQQSWRYSFFPIAPLDTYDPSIPGTYAVYFLIRDAGDQVVARSDIQVLIGGAPPVVPPTLTAQSIPSLNWVGVLLAFMSILLVTTLMRKSIFNR